MLPDKKRGAVLVGPSQAEIQERPLTKPGPGEAVIKIDYCGMCGSDTHGWSAGGAVFTLGTMMGHEPVGTVAEVGEGVTRYKEGDRVAINGFKPCGTCAPCRQGLYNICVNNMTQTIGNSDKLDGAFADYLWLPDADLMAVKVPDNLSQEDAALAEPLATSFHAVRLSGLQVGDTAAVIGAGPVGLLAVQVLKAAGAGKIIISQRPGERRDLALKLGAAVAINPRDEKIGVGEQIREVTDGGADVVIECAGAPPTVQQAIDMARPGGLVMLVGVNEKESPVIPLRMILGEVGVKGSLAWTHRDFEMSVGLLASGRIDAKPLISTTVSLDNIQTDGFERLKKDRSLIKLLVKP